MENVRYIILSFVISESVDRLNLKLNYNWILCNTHSLLHNLGVILQNVDGPWIGFQIRVYGTKERDSRRQIFHFYLTSPAICMWFSQQLITCHQLLFLLEHIMEIS
jgi:hypothetical protein